MAISDLPIITQIQPTDILPIETETNNYKVTVGQLKTVVDDNTQHIYKFGVEDGELYINQGVNEDLLDPEDVGTLQAQIDTNAGNIATNTSDIADLNNEIDNINNSLPKKVASPLDNQIMVHGAVTATYSTAYFLKATITGLPFDNISNYTLIPVKEWISSEAWNYVSVKKESATSASIYLENKDGGFTSGMTKTLFYMAIGTKS